MGLKDKNGFAYLTENVFQLRHAASGGFIDVRGSVADKIMGECNFEHWKVDEGHTVFFHKADGRQLTDAVVSYDSITRFIYNPTTDNFFPEKAASFWKLVKSLKNYNIPNIKRIGVRTKYFMPSKLGFSDVYETLKEKIFKQNFLNDIKGEVKDLQFVLEIKQNDFNMRLQLGATKENEAQKYFSFKNDLLLKPGMYIDIDCFMTQSIDDNNVAKLLKRANVLIKGTIDAISLAVNVNGD